MISSLDVFFVSVAINTLNFKLCYSACARAEYEVNGECCPMCAPGNRVYKHCTEFTSTTCVPCSNSSYTSQPNGLLSCLPCTHCDPGKVKTVCTRQSDAVCEPLEGFYCTDHRSGGCIQATEHTKCSPGEYIQQTGQHASVDTVCSGCAEGTFSNGSLHTCRPHSHLIIYLYCYCNTAVSFRVIKFYPSVFTLLIYVILACVCPVFFPLFFFFFVFLPCFPVLCPQSCAFLSTWHCFVIFLAALPISGYHLWSVCNPAHLITGLTLPVYNLAVYECLLVESFVSLSCV
uniref:TNFR-Cys domain-containing protein n=1 Tax=Astyanax mexicanus TaxID=7994 RepID=A0A3B1JFH7_ASTMX